MTEALLELETLVSMAALESHVRLGDLKLLQVAANLHLDARDWCLLAARFVFGTGARPATRDSRVGIEAAVDALLYDSVFEGLASLDTSRLINLMNHLITALEDARRLHEVNLQHEVLAFALVESIKAVMFGRNLNIAERSGLRGLYQRERLLQQL